MAGSKLGLFEELVASEAAIRADYIFRHNGEVTFNEGDHVVRHSIANPDAGNSRQEVADKLYDVFIKTYDYMLQDSSQHHKRVDSAVYASRDLDEAGKRELKKAFTQFAGQSYGEDGSLALTADTAPKALQALYEEIQRQGERSHESGGQHKTLEHASIALGALFVEMARGDKWKGIAPNGLDFTRGEPTDNLSQRFSDALNAPNHQTESSTFIQPPGETIEIAGMRFPFKKVNDHWTHLVTETGHLVDLTTEGPDSLKSQLEQHIRAGKPLGDFAVKITDEHLHLAQFEPSPKDRLDEQGKPRKLTPGEQAREDVREQLTNMATADSIDGKKVRDKDGQLLPVTIASMDVDLMTGLHLSSQDGKPSELAQFKKFIAAHGVADLVDLVPKGMDATITAMVDENDKQTVRREISKNVSRRMEQLKEDAAGDAHMQGLLARAQAKLEVMMPRAYEASDAAFFDEEGRQKKAARTKPHAYLTQGGTGSGKSSLKAIAVKECGSNLVEATLDDARSFADRYCLYPALNNHNDDYKTVEQFGNVVRDLVTQRGLQGGYHMLIDGSGIPYEGRNDKIVKKFKDHGYDVSVMAAQSPIFVLGKDGKLYNDAGNKIGGRLDKQLRGVPMKIVVDKHIGFAIASRNAARDPNVDRFMIQDTSGEFGKSYTLSYTINVDQNTADAIGSFEGEKLKRALLTRKLVPDWVKLPEGLGREHQYDLKFIRDNNDGTYRVEVITDLKQYVNMVQKGLLRRDAKGREALEDNTVRSDVDGYFKAPGGKLRMQSPEGVIEADWTHYNALSQANNPLHQSHLKHHRSNRPAAESRHP